PTGYSFVKGMESQTIIINEKGELIKQAFIWRANAMTYEQIRILRASNSGGIQLPELIKGFKERNGEKIIKQLKAWHDQIREN
ncbi:MAG: hypothetical protein ABIP51_00250, partial [Bacteroidia bacterium]